MVGYIISDIDNSQKCYSLFDGFNQDITVFYQNIHKTKFQVELPIFNVCYAYNNFYYPLISTCINTTKILKQCVSTPRKLFYVYDLEWLFIKASSSLFEDVYLDPSIDLIANSPDDFDIIKSCWKRPIGIAKEFDHEKIKECIRLYNNS